MSFATFRRYVVLVCLTLFVAYFGVWQLYQVMLTSLGSFWAVVLATMASFGVGVIAIVGMIIVRTKAIMEVSKAKKEEPK